MPEIHAFESSGEAYDASQCEDHISDGDILLVPSEKSAAILVSAWPTRAVGEDDPESAFHEVLIDGDDSFADTWHALDFGKYGESFVLAQRLLNEDGSLTLIGESAVEASDAREAERHQAFLRSIGY